MKIKIAYLISTLGTGGAERQLVRTVNLIDKNKFNIKLFVLTDVNEIEDELADTIPVEYLNLSSYIHPKNHFKVYQALKEFNPQILHSVMYASNLFARFYKIRKPKVIVINHIHGLGSWIQKKHIWLDRFLLPLVDKLVVVSLKSKEIRLKREKYPASKLEIIYNCVDTVKYSPNLRSTANKKITLGIACRLIDLKQVDYTIKLCKELKRLGLPIDLKIAGDGPEKNNLIKLTEKLQLQTDVHFLGTVKNMPKFYDEIDCFILNSKVEDLPLSIVEALASGKTFIASNVGGIAELSLETESLIFELENKIKFNAQLIKEFLIRRDFSIPVYSNRDYILNNFSEQIHKERFEKIYLEFSN